MWRTFSWSNIHSHHLWAISWSFFLGGQREFKNGSRLIQTHLTTSHSKMMDLGRSHIIKALGPGAFPTDSPFFPSVCLEYCPPHRKSQRGQRPHKSREIEAFCSKEAFLVPSKLKNRPVGHQDLEKNVKIKGSCYHLPSSTDLVDQAKPPPRRLQTRVPPCPAQSHKVEIWGLNGSGAHLRAFPNWIRKLYKTCLRNLDQTNRCT